MEIGLQATDTSVKTIWASMSIFRSVGETGTNFAERISISSCPTALLELYVNTGHWHVANSAYNTIMLMQFLLAI